MDNQKRIGMAASTAVVIFVVLIVAVVLTNHWLQKTTDKIAPQSLEKPVAEQPAPVQETEKPKRKRTGEVIRKTRLSPDRKYDINVFYQEGDEIARNKSSNGEIYDQTGEIPNGKVKFFNESDGTYGVEYYQDQRRHGPSNVYYNDDVMKKEMYYQYGKLMTSTEYYHDGTVRMTEDYTDARENDEDNESGIGKVYFRDGKIKYEWYFTVKDPVGYKKSYDGNGRLVAEFYYDEYGQPFDPNKTAPETEAAPAPVNTDNGMPAEDSNIIYNPPKQIFVPNS